MALRFSLIACLLLAAATVMAQGFGRFGYTEDFPLPGLTLDREGFRAKHPRADRLTFYAPAKEWRPLLMAPDGVMLQLNPKSAFQPEKARLHLTGPGFSVFCPMGLRLKLTSTAAPYLTWREGSVTNGVPTPPSQWLVLSFRDSQPAIAFGFPDAPATLQITGQPGAWLIQTPMEYSGWVRIGLPLGVTETPTNSAATLGRLAQSVQEQEVIWTNRAPSLVSRTVESDALSVTSEWTFDGPGAVVPNAAVFADLGGYPIKIEGERVRTKIVTEEGPTEIVSGNTLKIRFPTKRIPTGRALAIGAQLSNPIGTVSPHDIPGVVELALESLLGARDVLTAKSATDTLTEYLTQANYHEERWTGQKLPFDATGKELDLAAAHSLLMQAIASTTKPGSEANSLMTSIQWRQDWLSWLPYVENSDSARRAAALMTLTAALCPEPDRRLIGGMFQAGLAGSRGLEIWRRRAALIEQESPLLEPIHGIRQGLYGLKGSALPGSEFVTELLSPLRVFSEGSALLEQREDAFYLGWHSLQVKEAKLTLASGYPLTLVATENIGDLNVVSLLGLYDVRYTPELPGRCSAQIQLADWAPALPRSVQVPRYSEAKQ